MQSRKGRINGVMKIGITGASGNLGSATVRYLKERIAASDIVGISRSTDKVKQLGIGARAGDFDQPATLASTFAGLDRLIIIPTSEMTPGARARQHRTAVQAAVEADVKHVVFISALGARAGRTGGIQESYFEGEQTLMRLATEWTILRMAYYAESLAQQAAMTLPGGVHASIASTPVNFVSRDDVAAAAAGILATTGHHGAIYQATGPASLDGAQRAAAIAKASGKPMQFVELPLAQYRQGLEAAQLPPPIVEAMSDIQEMWANGSLDVTTGDVQRLAGKAPRSLGDVLASRLR